MGEVQWVGQIDNETGKVRIWDLKTGDEETVRYQPRIKIDAGRNIIGLDQDCLDQPGTIEYGDHEPYFITNSIDNIQTVTVNDFTLVTNRMTPVTMSRQEHSNREPEGFYEIRTLAGSTEYAINFFSLSDDVVDEVVRVSIIEKQQTGTPSLDPADYP